MLYGVIVVDHEPTIAELIDHITLAAIDLKSTIIVAALMVVGAILFVHFWRR